MKNPVTSLLIFLLPAAAGAESPELFNDNIFTIGNEWSYEVFEDGIRDGEPFEFNYTAFLSVENPDRGDFELQFFLNDEFRDTYRYQFSSEGLRLLEAEFFDIEENELDVWDYDSSDGEGILEIPRTLPVEGEITLSEGDIDVVFDDIDSFNDLPFRILAEYDGPSNQSTPLGDFLTEQFTIVGIIEATIDGDDVRETQDTTYWINPQAGIIRREQTTRRTVDGNLEQEENQVWRLTSTNISLEDPDIATLANHLLAREGASQPADQNGDGTLDSADIRTIMN